MLHLFLLVKQCFPLPQLILWCRYKIHCLEEDLLDKKLFWSVLWSMRNHPYKSDEGCCHRASLKTLLTPQQLHCALKTKKCLVNLEEVFRKFCAEWWRVRALQWIKCNSFELWFWPRRNCAVVKSVVRRGQINVIQKQHGDAIPSVSGMWINCVTSLIFIISTHLFSKKISGWLVAWQQPMTLPYRRLGFGGGEGECCL